MNETSKWVLSQIQGLGYDIDESQLQASIDSGDTEWFYNTLSGEGWDLGTKDDFKNSLSSSPIVKEDASTSDVMGALRHAHDVDITKGQAGIDKKKKEDEEREAIRQQKINIGLTEQDKSDIEELASLKKRASSPAQFDETGIFLTQEPVYNQYGMPTNVTKPVNITLEEQIKEKEASMPSYTTRGENSSLDIDANAIERALTTDEGRNLRDTIYNKYAQEFKSSVVYQDLVDEFKKGTITEQDINNTFSELYSQKINNDFYEEIAKKGGLMHEYIKDAETRLNTKLAGEGAFNLQSRIDAAKEEYDSGVEERFEERYKQNYGVEYKTDPLRGIRAQQLMSLYPSIIERPSEIKFAEQFNKDAINLVNAVNNDEGFVSAMGNTLGDIDTYDMGINEIMRTVGIDSIIKKVEDDEALTENEELLLDAALNYFTVTAYYSNKLGRLYKAGQTTAASLPFIAQFVLSSGSLSVFEGAVKGATSAGGKKLVAALWKHGQKKLAHFLNKEGVKAIGKATQGLALAGVEGAVMTATWGLPKIEAGAQSRMLGQVQTDFNYSTNELEYKGRTNRQSREEAYKNATIDAYVEYVSEMVLNKAFEPIGAWARGTDTFGKIQRNNVVGTIVDIWDNPTWKSIRETTQFGNLPEEIVEEEIGGLLRWGLASDVNSAEDAGLNLDAQIDIVLGLAPTSLVFGGVGTVSHYGSLWKGKREFRASLGSEEQKELFDKLMKESRSGQFGDLAHDLIREIVMDTSKPVEQKKKDIATIVSDYQQLLSKETQKLSQEVTEKENTKNAEELTVSLQNETDKHIYLTRDRKGRLLAIKGGDVILTKDEKGNNIIDQKKTSPQLRVSYLSDNGNVSDKEIDMNASELSAQVTEYSSEWFKGFKTAQATAVADKKDEFEHEGIVYNTQSGRYVGTKEEVDKRNKEEEEEDKLEEPKVNTKPHTISRTFELDVDGKKEFVTFFGSRVEQNEDGSIKNAGTTSIKLGDRILRNEGKQAIIDLISDKLKAEHAQALEEYRKKTATAEEASGTEGAVAPVELEPLLSDEERAAKALEDAKAEVRNNLPKDKNGELLFDKFTPEQLFIYESDTEGQDVALKTITDELAYLYTQLSKVDKKDVSPQQKKKEKLKIENDIKKNEDVIIKYFGQETLDKITAARAESLQLNTPPVQEGAPTVAPAQGETTPPAEPTVTPEQETPQGELPAEPDTTPLEPAEPVEEIDVEEKEPMNLLDGQYAIVSSNSTRGKEQIVKVTQNEDGTETWTSIHDGSTVSQKAYKKQQFPEQDNMRVLGIKEGNEITPVIVLSGLADLSQAKGELKVVPVNTKDGKVHEVHVSLLYKPEAGGGWSLLKGVGSRVLSPAEAAKYDSLDALLDFPIIPNVTVGNFTLRDMLEYPTLAKLKARLDQLGIEYDKQTINTNLETALARWRELVRENNLNEEFQNNLDKLSPSTLAVYKLYRAGVEPFKAGVLMADTIRTRSNINLFVQLDSIGTLPNKISNPLAQLAVLAEVASDLGIIQKKEKGRYIDAIDGILAKTQKEVKANAEEFTDKPKEVKEGKNTEDKEPEQPKNETPKQQKTKAETKEETPAPAKRKTNIDSLRDAFVEAYVRTQNQAYNAMQKTMAKTAFKGMIDKMSEEDAIALFLNLGLEAAKSQGKMQEDMNNAAQALLESKHGDAINTIIGGAQQADEVASKPSAEVSEETETEKTAEDAIDYEALVAERNELQETIYDMEDDEAANANARIAQINEILRSREEFMIGDVVVEHAESTKRIIKILNAAGIRVVTFKNKDLPKYVNKKKLEELSDGQIVYGFASNDTIYLNEDHFNPNSPLHEFTHLWVTAYKQAFAEDWKHFVDIANKSSLAANLRKPLKDGKASPYAKLSADEMASEVLSRYTGYLYGELDAEGRTAFENMMQAQTMEEKLAEKSLLKRIRDFWKKVISFFDKSIENENEEDAIDSMIRQFAQAPMETLARGREAVDKLMLNNTQLNLDNSQTSTAEREQIIAEAKANGTFMLAPNGQLTNLTEDQWVDVRTQAFKDWFGDWQNDPANASKVLDENGEPLVVYHGSKMAGFDEFQQLDESVNGFFTTDNKAGANTYATNREERRNNVMADEAQLNAEPHHGIYSLFVNIKNPAVYDFAGKMYNEYGEPLGYYVEMSGEEWDNQPVPKFATEEEALAFARENGEPDSAVKTTYLSTDDLVEMAKAAGHDGVIFKNVLDGAEHNEEQPVMNDHIAFEPNQLKSATQNIGTFNPEDNRIEFMIGTTPSGGPVNPMDIDSEIAAKIAVKTQQLFAVIADPKVDMPKEFGWIRRQIIDTLDRTEGIRWLMESIKKYRKENGLPPMGEGFDVRTMVEAMESKIMNQTRLYIETKENKLRDEVEKLAKKLNKSPLYKKYKLQNVKTDKGEDIELSTVQMVERYMIARDSYEREKIKGNARALGDFFRYMGVDVVTFMKEFEKEMFGSVKEFNAFWNAVRGCTDIVIDIGFETGLISLEDYETYKKREYYVPERDFAEVEDNEELAVDSHFHRSGRSNKLEGIREAKGGGRLAANILANIGLLGRDAIIKANKNIVKKAMYDLLRANEDWCRRFHVPVPHQVWYKKNADGSVERMTDAPTAEERELQNRIKAQIESIEAEIKQTRLLADSAATPEVKAKYENEIDELNEQISMLRDMMPFLDEFDTRNLIYATRAAQNESTVIVYVDGVAQEMLFPNMSSIAMALNGTYNKEWESGVFKKIGNIFSAGLTVYNPAFFAVNVARDVPFIATKGFAEYGMTFPIRFAIQLASKLFCRDIWRVVWNGDYASAKNEHVKEFFEGGANTGYTSTPDIKKLKNAIKDWGKGTTVTWSNLGDIISYLNTFSEVWTRAAAYSVVRNMGNNKEEGIRAAKNLSVNFNRKGLGNKFMNAFSSISIFMNAAIQGASGWYRTFKGDEETLAGKTWHATKAAMGFIFAPAFAGFIDTMLNPDDDDEMLYYSDYDRDNYVLLGDFRIPLNEQIKPFWCIGVNIALGMQGRRNREQRINSLMSSTFTNLFPLPPVINSSIVMAVNGVTGQRDYNFFQIMENLITPQALGGVHDLSNGVNFMGTQLSWDSGDIPQYMLGENEEAWSRELAHLAYIIGGGNKYLPSITRDNGKKILFDWNPKQISAARQTFVPSTFRDITDFFTGVFTGDLGSPEDYATIRRFYKPRDKEMGMYLIVSDAKQLVKRNEDIVSNMKKQLAGGKISNDRRKVEEANKRLKAAMSEKEIKEIKAYIKAYELMSIRERAKDHGMTEKAFKNALSKEQLKVYNKYNRTPREEMARKILILTREYNDIEVKDMALGEVIGL